MQSHTYIMVACNETDPVISTRYCMLCETITYTFTGCGNSLIHSTVFLNCGSWPQLLKSPEWSSTSPGGTSNVREWVSEMQTKRVQPSPGCGGGLSISYATYTLAVFEAAAELPELAGDTVLVETSGWRLGCRLGFGVVENGGGAC